jgi:hypothetical protein
VLKEIVKPLAVTDPARAERIAQARSDGFVVAGGAVVQLFGVTDIENRCSDFGEVREFELTINLASPERND